MASEIYDDENLRTCLQDLDQYVRIRYFISKPLGLDDFKK